MLIFNCQHHLQPSSIRCRDSNPQPLSCESSALTTRPWVLANLGMCLFVFIINKDFKGLHHLVKLITLSVIPNSSAHSVNESQVKWRPFMGSRIMLSIGYCSGSQTGGPDPFWDAECFLMVAKIYQDCPIILDFL